MLSISKISPKLVLNRHGIALLIVLGISIALLVFGSSYINSVSNIKKVNPKVLEQLQSDFFAQGINRIALLKFKKYPADFYSAYFYDYEKRIGNAGIVNISPWPLTVFNGQDKTTLRDNNALKTSSKVASYSTVYKMVSHKPYLNDGIEILVYVQIGSQTRDYRTTVVASRTRVL